MRAQPMTWPFAFIVTLLVEVPVYIAALTLVTGIRVRPAVAMSVAVNAVSHPLLWFVIVPALGAGLSAVLAAEALVLAGEAIALMAVLRRDRLVLAAAALVANGLSFAVGVALQR